MEIKIRKEEERGKTKLDWLDSRHGFSFGRYHNPSNINFGKLIVFNDDIILPGKGFGAHPHENAEVVTIVLEGSLKHEDSQGNKGIIKPEEIQRMSAGTGIWHSEYNASNKDNLHLLQIWLEPKEFNIKPGYEQKSIRIKNNELIKIISNDHKLNLIKINQDVEFFLAYLDKMIKINHILKKDSDVYLFVIKGSISLNNINNTDLFHGDSAEITFAKNLVISSKEKSAILLIEMMR
jgi:hypothetical protein